MGFYIFAPPKKHHCEAQIHQIRIKGYPYYLYFDEFLNIFTIFATPYYVRIMTYAVGLCKKWVVSTEHKFVFCDLSDGISNLTVQHYRHG